MLIVDRRGDIMIRQLFEEDQVFFTLMETGINDDYIERIFPSLTKGNHVLYGLFVEDQLVSMAGYTVFSNYYAMLGRLRSDRRFQGKGYSTSLLAFVIERAKDDSNVEWIGANTERDNLPAQKILARLHMKKVTTLFNATRVTAPDTSFNEAIAWKEIVDIEAKQDLLIKEFVDEHRVFPYECYYSFPATHSLFLEANVNDWCLFQHPTEDRFVIFKYDQKGTNYLHMVYPWDDLWTQEGLWEVVRNQVQLFNEKFPEGKLWIDLSETQKSLKPEDVTFEIPSPWILFEVKRD